MSSLFYYLKLFLMLLCLTTTECNLGRSEYKSYPGIKGELKLYYYPATWDDAQKICAEEGAVLASPSNEDMKQALDEEIRKLESSRVIVTGVKKLTRHYFYSIEGVPLDAMPVQWLPRQPDNEANQDDCIAYTYSRIEDLRCVVPLPFVCYRNNEFTRKDDCPEGYKLVSLYNKCYKLHEEPRLGGEADDACRAEGGQLAKFLVPKPLGPSEVILWSHVLNVISAGYFDYLIENFIFISFVDDNNGNWSDKYRHHSCHIDHYQSHPNTQTPCAAIRILNSVRVIAHPCHLASSFLCESPKVKNN